MGASNSGDDLALELSKGIDDMYLVARNHPNMDPYGFKKNIQRVLGSIIKIEKNNIHISNGEETQIIKNIDCIVFCTGYKYNFDFLKNVPALNQSNENFLYPIYKHIFYAHDPSLLFIGLPYRIIPFALFECQAILTREFLLGNVALPASK
jgi:hypothetical protein